MPGNEVRISVTASDQASGVLDKTKKSAGGLKSALGDMAKVAGGFVLAQGLLAAPKILSSITSTARDVELQMNKANTVFGDQIDVVKKWAAENAAGMGLTKTAATSLAASFGDLLIPMGFTRKEAAEMATNVVGLSGALSEWSGGQRTAAEVSDILAKAMLGEKEGLKTLGISITEAEIKTRLLKNGTSDLKGEQLQQAKATATQELIFEKSTDAQAAYADGAGSAARMQAELSATIAEMKEALAVKLAPAILKGTQLLATFAKTMGSVARVAGENKDLLLILGTAVLGAVLIPKLIAAAAAVQAFGATLAAVATAQNVSMFTALVQSLALGPVSLPVLAIGAVAAGLAIFGLVRHFRKATDEGEKFKDELEEIGKAAELANLDPLIAQGTKIVESWQEVETELQAVQAEYDALTVGMDEVHTKGRQQQDDAKLLMNRIADLEAQQEALVESNADLGLSQDQLREVADEIGLTHGELIAQYPRLARAAEQTGQSVEEFTDDALKPGREALDDYTESIKGVADALNSDLTDAVRNIADVETEEEVRIQAQISFRKAQKASILELVSGIEDDLSPAQLEEIERLDAEILGFKATADAINARQTAQGDFLATLIPGLVTEKEHSDLMAILAGNLTDVQTQEVLAALNAGTLNEALDKLDIPDALKDDINRALNIPLDDALTTLRGIQRNMSIDVRRLLSGGGAPSYHHGGVVPGPIGQEVLTVLQAGERVIPINQAARGAQGGAGGNVYVDQVIITGDPLEGLAALGLAGAAA